MIDQGHSLMFSAEVSFESGKSRKVDRICDKCRFNQTAAYCDLPSPMEATLRMMNSIDLQMPYMSFRLTDRALYIIDIKTI